MMNNSIFYVLAILAGVMLAAQAGINSQLRSVVGSPILATLISFLVGTFFLLLYILTFQRPGSDTLAGLQTMAWHKWTGGLIGAFYVTGVIIVAPRIGATNTTALIVGGQIIFALFLDHFGYLGFTRHAINFMRIFGAIMLISGVYIILKN
jgi:transporter family-2 protein